MSQGWHLIFTKLKVNSFSATRSGSCEILLQLQAHASGIIIPRLLGQSPRLKT